MSEIKDKADMITELRRCCAEVEDPPIDQYKMGDDEELYLYKPCDIEQVDHIMEQAAAIGITPCSRSETERYYILNYLPHNLPLMVKNFHLFNAGFQMQYRFDE